MGNKLKVFWLSRLDIMYVLCRDRGLPEYVTIPKFGIPDGARVHHLFWEPMRMAFGVVVEHESFPEVPADQVVPMSESWNVERVSYFVVSKHTVSNFKLLDDAELCQVAQAVHDELQKRKTAPLDQPALPKVGTAFEVDAAKVEAKIRAMQQREPTVASAAVVMPKGAWIGPHPADMTQDATVKKDHAAALDRVSRGICSKGMAKEAMPSLELVADEVGWKCVCPICRS